MSLIGKGILRTSGSLPGELVFHTTFCRDWILRLGRLGEMRQADEEAGVENGIKLPSMEIARTFAVESIDYPHPLGFQ
jgi:hypothetical protein